ncbi:unnamed protein product [Amoebophrya sp. A25]|nr:unnamed protein product [Amoebophrya sp. A25]|eukprot:GSA25T00020065001.1
MKRVAAVAVIACSVPVLAVKPGKKMVCAAMAGGTAACFGGAALGYIAASADPDFRCHGMQKTVQELTGKDVDFCGGETQIYNKCVDAANAVGLAADSGLCTPVQMARESVLPLCETKAAEYGEGWKAYCRPASNQETIKEDLKALGDRAHGKCTELTENAPDALKPVCTPSTAFANAYAVGQEAYLGAQERFTKMLAGENASNASSSSAQREAATAVEVAEPVAEVEAMNVQEEQNQQDQDQMEVDA